MKYDGLINLWGSPYASSSVNCISISKESIAMSDTFENGPRETKGGDVGYTDNDAASSENDAGENISAGDNDSGSGDSRAYEDSDNRLGSDKDLSIAGDVSEGKLDFVEPEV